MFVEDVRKNNMVRLYFMKPLNEHLVVPPSHPLLDGIFHWKATIFGISPHLWKLPMLGDRSGSSSRISISKEDDYNNFLENFYSWTLKITQFLVVSLIFQPRLLPGRFQDRSRDHGQGQGKGSRPSAAIFSCQRSVVVCNYSITIV